MFDFIIFEPVKTFTVCVRIITFRPIFQWDLWWQGLVWGRWGRVTAHCTEDQMNHNNCQSVVSLLNREIHNYMILTLKLVSRYHTYPPWQMIKLQHCFVVSQMQCKSALVIPMNTQCDFDYYILFSALLMIVSMAGEIWANMRSPSAHNCNYTTNVQLRLCSDDY